MAPSENASDHDLVELIKAGDERAFEVLYQRYRLQLYSYLNRVLRNNTHLADDIFQQTWTKVFNNIDSYVDSSKFISWLYRIAHNLVVDHVRRESRAQLVQIDERIADEGLPAWSEIDSRELAGALAEAIETLTDDQKEVVLLRQHGMPFKDIAVIQNTGINTVLGRMHYAVKSLQKWFLDWEPPVTAQGD